jgi:hypothetical protein
MAKSNLAVAKTKTITVTPTVAAASHAIGDCLGPDFEVAPCIELPNRGAVLHAITYVADSTISTSTTLDVLLFNNGATALTGTYTDDAAVAVSAADCHFLIGVAQLSTHVDLGTPNCLVATGLNIPFEVTTPHNHITAAIVVRGAAHTPSGTGTENVHFHFLAD